MNDRQEFTASAIDAAAQQCFEMRLARMGGTVTGRRSPLEFRGFATGERYRPVRVSFVTEADPSDFGALEEPGRIRVRGAFRAFDWWPIRYDEPRGVHRSIVPVSITTGELTIGRWRIERLGDVWALDLDERDVILVHDGVDQMWSDLEEAGIAVRFEQSQIDLEWPTEL